MAGKSYHSSRFYRRTAPIVRQQAYAKPHHRCPICGMTLAEMRQARPGKIVGWDAGHRVAGDDRYGLEAQCSHCNRSSGATMGNKQRNKTTSRNWGV